MSNFDPMSALRPAIQVHRSGNFKLAEMMYRQVLTQMPGHPDGALLLGTLLVETGRHAEGIAWIQRSIATAPRKAVPLNVLGNVLFELGDLRNAEQCYRAAVQADPNAAELHCHLGITLVRLGNDQAAQEEFRSALKLNKELVAPRIDLSNLLLRAGKFSEAESVILAAARRQPQNPMVQNTHGIVLASLHRDEEALACFDKAIELGHRGALHNRAGSLVAQQRYEEAAAAYHEVLRLNPAEEDAQRALGQVLVKLQDYIGAIDAMRALVARDPNNARAQFAMGALINRHAEPSDALPFLREAVKLDPQNTDFINGLSISLYDAGAADESMDYAQQAAVLAPENPDIRSGVAYAHLLRGDYARGWPEFEWRLGKASATHILAPAWDGAITEKSVFVHAEQGIGDTIQFCRFLPLAGQRARIVFAGPTALRRLLQDIPGVAQMVTDGQFTWSPPVGDDVIYAGKPKEAPVAITSAAGFPSFDVQCALMSLPHLLQVQEADLATAVPYLRAAPDEVEKMKARLGSGTKKRVGLCWAGNRDYPADRRRSIEFEVVSSLLAEEGVEFISLQKGEHPDHEKLADFTEDLQDYADTAALIAALDLVISVDTSVAHLAGAMGAPVWLLNRKDTDWRWLQDRENSPWYPSMRIFRQVEYKDWEDVIARVHEALRKFVTS